MSIAQLLQAAEYLEKKDKDVESEHGYAATFVTPPEVKRRMRAKRSMAQSRTTHNELEKHRRAQLRCCLEDLKNIVPLGSDTSRHTTLGLLTKARAFIKHLEMVDEKREGIRMQLLIQQEGLRRRLAERRKSVGLMRGTSLLRAQPALSSSDRKKVVCSVSDCSSESSGSSQVEVEQQVVIDIMTTEGGLETNSSDDTDDSRSNSSDGGMTVTTVQRGGGTTVVQIKPSTMPQAQFITV